jgi:hypothetical protein
VKDLSIYTDTQILKLNTTKGVIFNNINQISRKDKCLDQEIPTAYTFG